MSDQRPAVDRRTFLQFAGAAAATATVVGAGSGAATSDAATATDAADAPALNTVEVLLANDPVGVDPHDERDQATRRVVRNGYEGLLGRDRTGAVGPALATGYERTGRTTVEFTLREGVTFHDGTPLTAADVAYSIERVVDPDVDIASPQAVRLDDVRGATALDDRTVAVRTDGDDGVVPAELASFGTVVSEAWAAGNDEDAENATMNGTGPYRLEARGAGSVTLRRSDDYWGPTSAVERVRFRGVRNPDTRALAVIQGEADVATDLSLAAADRVRDADGVRLATVPGVDVLFAAMRYDVDPFESRRFRLAMNYAVDQEHIVADALDGAGDVTGQPTLAGFAGHAADVDPYPYDPARAKRLIDASGHAGATVELHAPADRYTGGLATARQVVDFVDAVPNVSATLRRREYGSLVGDLTTGDVDDKPPWYLIQWGNHLFDAATTLRPLLSSDGAISSFADDDLDSLLERARRETGAVRAATLREANRRAHDQAPWLFLPRQYRRYAVRERVDWTPRIDGLVDVAGMRPAGDGETPSTTTPAPTTTPTATTPTPTTPREGPTFRLRQLSVPARTARGETVTVAAVVENVGSEDGVLSLSVRVDGDLVTAESTVLGAGEATTVEATVNPAVTASLATGEHDLAVRVGEDATERTLVVESGAPATTTTTASDDGGTTPTEAGTPESPSPTPSPTPTRPTTGTPTDATGGTANGTGATADGETDGGGLPGFGLSAALAGLSGAAALRWWRGDGEE